MSVFVTGASGFIGSHLVNELKKEHQVMALVRDVVPSRWLSEALEGCVKVRGDIRNFPFLRRVLNEYEVERVYHLAAFANVKQANKDPLHAYDVNVMGTVKLLEACRQLDVGRILVLSTDKVYGERMKATVEDPREPSEPYATSKICQDIIAESYVKTYGLNVLNPHSCNVFGYDPQSNRIFPNTIKACLRGESPLIFTNDESIREYIYVYDLVDALQTLMEKHERGPYNIATGYVYNQRDIVLMVLKHFPDLKPKHVEMKLPVQVQKETMAMTRWSWKPKWGMIEAVTDTVEAFRHYGW